MTSFCVHQQNIDVGNFRELFPGAILPQSPPLKIHVYTTLALLKARISSSKNKFEAGQTNCAYEALVLYQA